MLQGKEKYFEKFCGETSFRVFSPQPLSFLNITSNCKAVPPHLDRNQNFSHQYVLVQHRHLNTTFKECFNIYPKAYDLLFESFRNSWLHKEGIEVYSDLIFTTVTVLFMRKMSGFFPELSWVVPFEKGCTKCKLNWTSVLRQYSLLRIFIV